MALLPALCLALAVALAPAAAAPARAPPPPPPGGRPPAPAACPLPRMDPFDFVPRHAHHPHELGHGYQGTVSRGRVGGAKAVAKHLHLHREGHERARRSIEREARALCLLQAPGNPPRPNDLPLERGVGWVARDLLRSGSGAGAAPGAGSRCICDGLGPDETVDHLLKVYAGGTTVKELKHSAFSTGFPPEVVGKIGLQVARAMEFMAARGVGHHDLALRNVVLNLGKSGRGRNATGDHLLGAHATLIDLGEARPLHEAQDADGPAPSQGDVPHTEWYKNDHVNFGRLLYEMLTGDKPPRGFKPDSRGEPVGLWAVAGRRPAGVPDGLWGVIQGCWARDPRARPAWPALVARLRALAKADQRRGTRLRGSEESNLWTP